MYPTTIGNLELSNIICNASGVWDTTDAQITELSKSDFCGGVVTKSCTLKPRIGNPYPKYHFTDNYSINSNGLENKGIDYYLDVKKKTQHPIIISVGGMSDEERCQILNKILDQDHVEPIAVEINMSCPNLGCAGPSYDPETLKESLDYIAKNCRDISGIDTLGLKLPPFYLQKDFEAIANVIMWSTVKIDFITCINGVPNVIDFDIDNDTLVIGPNYGHGGMGGRATLPIGLANVKKFSEIFRNNGFQIDVVGCGGVETGTDVYKYILAGASAVQVGTYLWQNGPTVFKKISDEFHTIMQRKGFTGINEIILKN